MELKENILEMNGIVKFYGKHKALDGIDIVINSGDIFGLLGPNGSGKSTTMKIISGLLSYDSGSCYIFNKDIRKHKKIIQQKIGLVTQEYSIYNDLKAKENVEFIGRLYGLSGDSLKSNVVNALELVDLTKYSNKYPSTFSGGMKRRLNIACALVHKPELLIMDEPTASLDPISRAYILKSIKDINSSGTTIIYTSHYLDEVEQICNRAAIINLGKVIADGKPEQIKKTLKAKYTVVILLEGVGEKQWGDIDRLLDELRIFYSININFISYGNNSYNKNYKININCWDPTKVIEKIIPYLKERHTFIRDISIERNSLEEIFVELIQHKNEV